MALLCMGIVLVTALLGIFAPWVAPNDPYANDILNKFDSPSWQYPLGTDHLGRCVFSRMLFGIRPTLFLSLLTMLGTIGLGVIMGITAGYFRGTVDEVIMRVVDVMLSFPSQIIILAVVALLGVDIRNVVIASIFIKWAWYARMIRTATIKYTGMNFVLFSRSIGSGNFYILTCFPASPQNWPYWPRWIRDGPSSTSLPFPSSGWASRPLCPNGAPCSMKPRTSWSPTPSR